MENQMARVEQQQSASSNLEILAGAQLLARDGQDAQKGSRVAEEGLLDTAEWLEGKGLLDEVMSGLENLGIGKVINKDKSIPKELVFDRELPGYSSNNPVRVDLDKMQVNNKSREQLKKDAAAERKEFVDALASDKNRPIPEGEKGQMSPIQIKFLQKLEQALTTGDLALIKRAFQENSQSQGLWKRMEKEIARDFDSPPAVQIGKGADGKPYLAIMSEPETSRDENLAIVIRPQGESQVHPLNDNGEIDFGKKSQFSAEQVMAKQQMLRQSRLEEKMSDYRCDFDSHERTGEKRTGTATVKSIVQKYNTYTEHLCGSEFQD